MLTMGFQQLLERISNSQAFKDFKEEHPSATLCAGFFGIDFMGNDNKQTLDYRIANKVFTFSLNDKEQIRVEQDKLMELPNTPQLTTLENPGEVVSDIEDLKGIVGMASLEQGIHNKIHKIIAVLQNDPQNQEKKIWNLTCMLESLIILHIIVNPLNGEIIKFEKKSMMDLIKKK